MSRSLCLFHPLQVMALLTPPSGPRHQIRTPTSDQDPNFRTPTSGPNPLSGTHSRPGISCCMPISCASDLNLTFQATLPCPAVSLSLSVTHYDDPPDRSSAIQNIASTGLWPPSTGRVCWEWTAAARLTQPLRTPRRRRRISPPSQWYDSCAIVVIGVQQITIN